MTNNAHNFAVIKHQLRDKKEHGVKSVLWKLNQEQNRYVNETLNYPTEPEIYKVKTRKISCPGHWSPIIRDVNYAYRHSSYLYRRLDKSQLRELQEHDVQVTPFKYRVYLNWRLFLYPQRSNKAAARPPFFIIKIDFLQNAWAKLGYPLRSKSVPLWLIFVFNIIL